jgi:DNA-binding transcriptional regulator YhcF (GntR family)
VVPFKFRFHPGESIFDQVCFAATKAILASELKAGEPFPSVRTLALDLKIHPNTAHKVVQHLIQERWLVAQPGVGTVVAAPPKARAGDRRRLLEGDVEKLVVEAVRVGATLGEVQQAVKDTWTDLRGLKAVSNDR